MQKKTTSWGHVAPWYNELIEQGEDTYQKKVILPNLLRLMEPKQGKKILDLGCGQGFFSREFAKSGAQIIGVDISKELIAIARKNSPKNITFEVSPAHRLTFLTTASLDAVVVILAIQNIENIDGVFAECARILKPAGKFFIVMNHPTFRVLKESSWGWDEKSKTQYRRVDRYLSEMTVKIEMRPGANKNIHTISFHRPLQLYFKKLNKNGFAVTRLEEWISHKKSQKGPRAPGEDKARKEIPLFLFLEAAKIT